MPWRTSAILGCLAAAVALIAEMNAQNGGETKAIRFGRLWDGSKTIADAVVVVERDRIVKVGGSGDVPAGAQVIDLRRFTAVPGLIDLHTHITYYWDRQPGTRPLAKRWRPTVTVYLAQDNARRTLETGVTTIRGLGAQNETDFAMRDLVNLGAMIGPRMIVAGQGISAGRGRAGRTDAMKQAAEERIKSGSDWVRSTDHGASRAWRRPGRSRSRK